MPFTVFHFVPDLHVGGILRLLQYNLSELKEKNVRNVVIYFNSNEDGAYLFEKTNALLIRIPYKGIFSVPGIVFQLYKLVGEYKPRILHSHLPFDARFSYLLSFFTKASLIVTLHFAYDKTESETLADKLNRWIFTATLRRATAIIAVSQTLKNIFPEYLQEKITVIYSGVSDHSGRIIQDQKYLMPGSPKLLCVGRSHPIKGHIYLIELVKKLKLDFPDIRLYLFTKIGNSVSGREVLRRIEQEKITESLVVVEDINDPDLIVALYRNADLFVLPSRYESLGLSILEALSFGLPVIASNVGGIPEIIKDHYNGLLFPVGDMGTAAAHIRNLVSNPDKRKIVSSNARESFLADFNIDVSVERLFRFYGSLVRTQDFVEVQPG